MSLRISGCRNALNYGLLNLGKYLLVLLCLLKPFGLLLRYLLTFKRSRYPAPLNRGIEEFSFVGTSRDESVELRQGVRKPLKLVLIFGY